MDEGMDRWIKTVRAGKSEKLPPDETTHRWLRAIHAQLEAIRRWAVLFGILLILGVVISLLKAIFGYIDSAAIP